MTTTIEFTHDAQGRWNGSQRVIRNDAVKYDRRYIVPTSEETRWVSTMEEFRAAGGQVSFNEDQTEIELLLPQPYKFSIGIFRD